MRRLVTWIAKLRPANFLNLALTAGLFGLLFLAAGLHERAAGFLMTAFVAVLAAIALREARKPPADGVPVRDVRSEERAAEQDHEQAEARKEGVR
jgi:hypothetical protein